MTTGTITLSGDRKNDLVAREVRSPSTFKKLPGNSASTTTIGSGLAPVDVILQLIWWDKMSLSFMGMTREEKNGNSTKWGDCTQRTRGQAIWRQPLCQKRQDLAYQ